MIEDGCLRTTPKPRITEDLISKESYGDFELKFDWRISPHGNTVVKYRIQRIFSIDNSMVDRSAGFEAARARIAEKRKDWVAAEREFRAAWEAAPSQVGRALDVATFLSSRGRYAESDAVFRAAEEKYPNAPKVLFARAAAYVHSKRMPEEARALVHRYLEAQITPDDPSRREALALLRDLAWNR